MSTYATTTSAISGWNYGLVVSPERSEDRPKTPSGLIVTQAVQTKDGWLGQVIVDKSIVWEGEATEDSDDAIQAANRRVVEALTALFSSPGIGGTDLIEKSADWAADE